MQHYEGRAALLVLATGLGKTRIFTEFLRWEVNENDHHCLILSHREELVHQPLTYLQDLTCGVELADKRANHEPIISASVQSLVSRLDKYNPREIDTIIVVKHTMQQHLHIAGYWIIFKTRRFLAFPQPRIGRWRWSWLRF